MTTDQIVEEARQWPTEKLADLVDRLTLTLQQTVEPNTEEAWKKETRRRLAEIESGRVQVVPGEEVSRKIQRIVGR